MSLAAPAPAAAAPGKPSAEAKQLAREAALNSALRAFGKGAGHAESCGCGTCAALNERQATPREPVDDVDAIGIEEAGDWEAQTGAMGQAIVEAAALSSSYGEFRARLTALVAGLDTGPLQARLAIASMKARGLGTATDDV